MAVHSREGAWYSLCCDKCGAIYPKRAWEYHSTLKKRSEAKTQLGDFCSRACYLSARTGYRRIERVLLDCAGCGKQFERRETEQRDLVERGVKSFFCSRKCHYKAAEKPLPQSIIDDYLDGASLQTIANAQGVSNSTIKEFLVRNGVERRSKTAQWTPDYRRQAVIARVAEGHYPIMSKLENRVEECLTVLGLSFVRQYTFREKGKYIAIVDFWIEGQTALEVNGTYWHCDPRVYPDGPQYTSQQTAFARYPRKLSALRGRGIRVAELWEIDFEKQGLEAIKVALAGAS